MDKKTVDQLNERVIGTLHVALHQIFFGHAKSMWEMQRGEKMPENQNQYGLSQLNRVCFIATGDMVRAVQEKLEGLGDPVVE